MYAQSVAGNAYGQVAGALRSDTETEYQIIARVSAELRKYGSAGSDFSKLAEAVHRNRRLWTLLAADVASPENKLPATLRARIFYLYEFTIQHSVAILDGRATVDALIDVNSSVMKGLSGRQEDAQ